MNDIFTQRFKNFIAIILYSNLFISFAAAAAVETTAIAAGAKSISYYPHIVIFLLTFTAYNFLRLTTGVKDIAPDKIIDNWIYQNRIIITLLSALSLIGAIIISLSLSVSAILALSLAGIVTVFYDLGKFGFPNLRSNPFTKVIAVAGAWSITTVVFPIYALTLKMTFIHTLLLFMQRFFFIAALAIPYDIADIERDIGNIKTIPSMIGNLNAKTLSYCMLVISSLIVSLNSAIGFISPSVSFVIFLTFVVSGMIVKLFNPKNDIYLYLVIDGMLVLQSLLVLMISKI